MEISCLGNHICCFAVFGNLVILFLFMAFFSFVKSFAFWVNL